MEFHTFAVTRPALIGITLHSLGINSLKRPQLVQLLPVVSLPAFDTGLFFLAAMLTRVRPTCP